MKKIVFKKNIKSEQPQEGKSNVELKSFKRSSDKNTDYTSNKIMREKIFPQDQEGNQKYSKTRLDLVKFYADILPRATSCDKTFISAYKSQSQMIDSL